MASGDDSDMEDILTLQDMEEAAKKKLPESLMQRIQGGATYEITMRENESALKKYKIRPRMLRDVSVRDLSTTLLGHRVSFPVAIAPSGHHQFVHPDGEVGTARGASSASTVMTISMASDVPTEEVMKECPSLLAFQQLFISDPKSITEKVVRTAEENGIKALVVSVDMPIAPIKYRDARAGSDLQEVKDGRRGSNPLGKSEALGQMLHGRNTWEDIRWLKSITRLPIIPKGIMCAEDARLALQYGVDAIWVSNHGGRCLDSLPATIDILEEVVNEVNGRCEVYIDGGFRSGLDVFKALALGARAVFIGRSVQYALAVGGDRGVKKAFDVVKKEFDNTMALSGCKDIAEITKDFVLRPGSFGISKI